MIIIKQIFFAPIKKIRIASTYKKSAYFIAKYKNKS